MYVGPLNLGDVYCLSAPNSTGQRGRIAAGGSRVVGHEHFTLEAFELPTNEFGYFIASRSQGFVALVENTGPGGDIDAQIDLGSIPTKVPTAVMPGESWNFQAWHRDGAGSNFSSAIEVVFE